MRGKDASFMRENDSEVYSNDGFDRRTAKLGTTIVNPDAKSDGGGSFIVHEN